MIDSLNPRPFLVPWLPKRQSYLFVYGVCGVHAGSAAASPELSKKLAAGCWLHESRRQTTEDEVEGSHPGSPSCLRLTITYPGVRILQGASIRLQLL